MRPDLYEVNGSERFIRDQFELLFSASWAGVTNTYVKFNICLNVAFVLASLLINIKRNQYNPAKLILIINTI